jgi:hypothetical protein
MRMKLADDRAAPCSVQFILLILVCLFVPATLSCRTGLETDFTPRQLAGSRSPAPVDISGLATASSGFIIMHASYDASCIVAGAAHGKLFHSDDGGSTWWTMDGLGRQEYWTGLAVSADGSQLVAAGQSLYVTDDSGLTWTQYPFAERYDGSVRLCMSGDGSTLLRIGENYLTVADISRDYGRTWTHHNFDLVGDELEAIGLSYDGSTMAVLQYFQPLHLSRDAGLTWNSADTGNEQWSALAMSPDGRHFALLSYGGVKYEGAARFDVVISHDAGLSWEMQSVDGISGADAVSITADGTTILVSGSGVQEPFMISEDGGGQWRAMPAPEKESEDWAQYTHVFAAGGSRIVVMERSHSIWISDDRGETWVRTLIGIYQE